MSKGATRRTKAAGPRVVKGLQITATDEGYIVYDAARERVHYLNHTAALILDLCTGQNSRKDIVDLVATAFSLPKPPRKEVEAVLAQFVDEGLIASER